MGSSTYLVLGKFGAIISQIGFAFLKDVGGKPGERAFIGHLFQILAFFMLTGLFSTFLIEETRGRTLEGVFPTVILCQFQETNKWNTQSSPTKNKRVLLRAAPAHSDSIESLPIKQSTQVLRNLADWLYTWYLVYPLYIECMRHPEMYVCIIK